MVQLIVYPSFLHYTTKNLIAWHKKYTQGIAFIVVPLMLLQLLGAIYTLFYQLNITTITSLFVVVFLWSFTFLGFAPLHFKISQGKFTEKTLQLLIQRNWWRTFLWTGLFILHYFQFIFHL